MKEVKLQFKHKEDVWDFLAATKKIHVEVEDATAEGWFTTPELELATEQFAAEVQPPTVKEAPAPAYIPPVTAIKDGGQPVKLYGKSGRTYTGKIYTKTAHPDYVSTPALICLANSTCSGDTWQHAVNAIYATDDPEQERERFSQRDDVSHLIVVPAEEWRGVDATDDLIRSYLHG